MKRPYERVRLVPNRLRRTRRALDNETSCRRKRPAQFLGRLTCKLDMSPLGSSSADPHHVTRGEGWQRPPRVVKSGLANYGGAPQSSARLLNVADVFHRHRTLDVTFRKPASFGIAPVHSHFDLLPGL